jgi:hypothetical protein
MARRTCGWPSIFYINLPFVAAAMPSPDQVEEVKEPEKARLDIVGAALATLGLGPPPTASPSGHRRSN